VALARRAPSLVPLALALLLVAGRVAADERDDVLTMRAADLEARGHCGEAAELYRTSGAGNAHMALIAGRCQVRSRDYAGAVETLSVASRFPEASSDVDLQLGIAQYHLGDLVQARVALDRARARGASSALLDLYTGLLELQAQDTRAAALSFERARRADARAVEPVASYYAFVAWRSQGEQERAEAALARVRASDPDGPWIAEAERVLGGGVAPSDVPRFWLDAEAGLEYDSNVTIRGQGVGQIFVNGDTISDKDDGRGVWSFAGGAELFRSEDWSGGVMGGYMGNAHFYIHEFDLHYPTVGAWVDHRLGEKTTLRGRYDYGYAWLNYDPYVSLNQLQASLFQGFDEAGETELTGSVGWYDFQYDRFDPRPGIPPVPPNANPQPNESDINQDGTLASVEILHRMSPGEGPVELRAGYRFSHYDSKGREFRSDAHRLLAGFDVSLPFEIGWDGWGAFTYQPYEHTSVYADSQSDARRRDRIWEAGTELEKFVTENVSVLARYRFTDSGSNTDVYDYDRHVVGGYVRIRFR
jgi:tetratricopeptide (TPR) repeat protein